MLIRSGDGVEIGTGVLAVGVEEPLRYTDSSKLWVRVGVENGDKRRSK